jgi:hypothetical protein
MIDWDEELSENSRDELIDSLANRAVKHGMASPAILFLEMHKPFGYLAGQAAILGSGFLGPFVGMKKLQQYSKLVQNRDNVEKLIVKIEQLAAGDPADMSQPSGAGSEAGKG